MSDGQENSGRKNGRPRKGEPPRVPYDEVDRLLVFGEVVKTEDGENTAVVFPSYRELARRYDVSHSLIAQYSRKHDCLRRRKEAKARIAVKTDQKIVEMRATALALSKEDALRMIDAYLVGFEKALSEERVRFDNPTDFNTMLRLKEFILGGADSRQEIHAALSLDDLQARHQRMLRDARSSGAVRGELVDADSASSLPPGESDQASIENSPAPPAKDAAEEVTVQPDEVAAALSPHGPVSAVGPEGSDQAASDAANAPHGRDVAPTAAMSSRTGDEPS